MKRFLLLALTAGLLSPIAAKAESIWLVLVKHNALEKIQMQSMDQCEEEAKKWSEKAFPKISKAPKYICLKGK